MSQGVEWKVSAQPIAYLEAVQAMESRVAAIRGEKAPELVWLLEHPPLYTTGTSAQESDLLNPTFPVFETGRGGQYTYHGPGQLVAYVMLDLRKRSQTPDIKKYICNLEQWIINTLQQFDIQGERRTGRVGIWVNEDDHRLCETRRNEVADDGFTNKDSKIAAIGVRVRHWVTYHGVSINLNPDLSHFDGIVPCGISDAGVTSFEALGVNVTREELQAQLQSQFSKIFEN
ncbi:MAG: lipoyl(octanoyl) transferase LipB [Alphaproteobacteria bacterium]|nr:lipoyl(octanoyl) transferase LipB [Alphaproteobacteria bacterium]